MVIHRFRFHVAGGPTPLAALASLCTALADDDERERPRTLQLGPRPFFLVDDMFNGKLETEIFDALELELPTKDRLETAV